MTTRKYKKLQAIFLFVEVIYNRKHLRHSTKKGTVTTKVKTKECYRIALLNDINSSM